MPSLYTGGLDASGGCGTAHGTSSQLCGVQYIRIENKHALDNIYCTEKVLYIRVIENLKETKCIKAFSSKCLERTAKGGRIKIRLVQITL